MRAAVSSVATCKIPVMNTCLVCEAPIARRRKYCSRQCTAEGKRTAVTVTCVCGTAFQAWPSRVNGGRGLFCSNTCRYANATRPTGLTYELTAENRAWFKPGSEPWNKDRATGQEPWNKGLKGIHLSPDTEFKLGNVPANWKGDEVGYFALHAWLRRAYGAPSACETCDIDEQVQWANRTGRYLRDRDDWLHLCPKCHRQYDLAHGLVGVVEGRFG